MFNWISDKINDLCKKGIHLPFAHDPESGKPSVTLLTYYLSLCLLVGSIINLHFRPMAWAGTSACIIMFALSFVFYRIRKIDKFKFDANNKSFEIESDSSSEQKSSENKLKNKIDNPDSQ